MRAAWGLSLPAAVTVLATVLTISTADGARTTQSEFVCPIDGVRFTNTTVTTKNRQGGADSDFCTYEVGPQALPHEVHTCPTCCERA